MSTIQDISAKASIISNKLKPIWISSNIFICEDKDPTIWQELFKSYSINNVDIISSTGCTNNRVENFIEIAKERDSTFEPKVFREMDRDGLTDQQINILSKKELLSKTNLKKVLGNNSYVIKPLPVHEIENFAVLIDIKTHFTSKFWKKNETKLLKKFMINAEENCRNYANKLDVNDKHKAQKEFRGGNGSHMSYILKMKKQVTQRTWRKYANGKEICDIIPNYNPFLKISDTPIHKHPKELQDYMKLIKDFFEN